MVFTQLTGADLLALPHDDAAGRLESQSQAQRLNWLRAGVLGAMDGIVAVSAVVVGVAGAAAGAGIVLAAGVAALAAGGMAMALGEYVSVSSQRDAEAAAIHRGESMARHKDLAKPWHAALASILAFFAGGIWPVLAAMLVPGQFKVPAIFVVVIVSMIAVGQVAAKVGGTGTGRSTVRMLVGGVLALAITFGIGTLMASFGIDI